MKVSQKSKAKETKRLNDLQNRGLNINNQEVLLASLKNRLRDERNHVKRLEFYTTPTAKDVTSLAKHRSRVVTLQKMYTTEKENLTNLIARQMYDRMNQNMSVRDRNTFNGKSARDKDRQARHEVRLAKRVAQGLPVGQAAADASKKTRDLVTA